MKRNPVKGICILAALALLGSFAACGGKTPSAPELSAAPDVSATDAPADVSVTDAPSADAQDPTDAPGSTAPADGEEDAPDFAVQCGAFGVTLPGWWTDKYLCETDEDSILFRYKTAPDDGIFLFRIGVSEGPDDIEEPGFGGEGIEYEVCKIEKDGRLGYLLVSEPDEYGGVPADDHDTYMAMLRLTDDIETRIFGVNGYAVRQFDYTGYLGVYTAADGVGGAYTLTLDLCRWNLMQGELSFSFDGGAPDTVENVTVRMFANAGCLTWARESAYDPGEWEFGSGVFMIEEGYSDETGYSLMLTAPGDSWTTTDGYLPLTRIADTP